MDQSSQGACFCFFPKKRDVASGHHHLSSQMLRGSPRALVSKVPQGNGSGSWQDLPSPHCPVTCGFSTEQDCMPACLFVHSFIRHFLSTY